jgi:CRISPR-associated protein Cas1
VLAGPVPFALTWLMIKWGFAVQGQIDRLERARTTLRDTPTLSAVLGVEGAGSRDYFAGLAKLLDSSWEFTGRRRRPPPDPINSLLSLGYTLLTQEATAAVEAAGLDPYFGFLHSARVGRPSLALNLVEEFRPVLVDSVALRAVRTSMLRQTDFVRLDGPPASCLLTRDGRHTFLAAYERRMLTLVTHPGVGRRVSYRVALGLQDPRTGR